MSNQQLGLLIVGVGLGIILLGGLVWLGGFSWFGNLPGDIRIERGGTRIYIPIASMLLLSLLLNVLLYVVRRLF